MKKITFILMLILLGGINTANAQEPFLAEIRMFAGNFAPRGWALCNGQLLSISENSALFSIIGCQFGGDCRTTFALPDLRGRVPVGVGNGPGLTPTRLAENYGRELATLTTSNLPSHTHNVSATTAQGTSNTPTNNLPATTGLFDNEYAVPTTENTTSMHPSMITPTGGSQPLDIEQPSLGINFIIAIEGVFPSRS